MQALAISYKDFSLYATPSGILNSMSVVGLPILIAYFYSIELAGVYFFANNIVRLPILLLSGATAQVFKTEAVEFVQSNKIDSLQLLIRKVQRMIFSLIFPVILLLSLFGNHIFDFLFGHQWNDSGNLIKYFSFYLIFGMNFSVISALIDILRLQKLSLLFNASLLFFQILIFVLCSYIMSFEYTLLINSLIGAIHFIFIDRYVKKKIR